MGDAGIPPQGPEWQTEVQAMSERLARESRRSGLIGFLGGAAVMAGLAILVWATTSQIRKNKSLATEVQSKTTLAAQAQQQAASATEQANTAKRVLGATVEDLQSQNAAVSASATSALDQAFETDPNAAKLLVRVYVHMHSQTQRHRAFQIARTLRTAGYLVPGIDVQPQRFKESEVHYYADNSQSVSDANAISKVVASTGVPCQARQVPQAPTDKLRPRAYGLWLATDLH